MNNTQPSVASGTIDFDLAANAWLGNLREKVLTPANDEFNKGLNRTDPYHILEVDAGRPSKFVRIWMRNHNSASCWAFIALTDGESKVMGRWRRGDIFKPNSWRGPAKHARGNIFEPGDDGLCNVRTVYGPEYLR